MSPGNQDHTAPRLFEAIGHKAWAQLEQLAAPDIVVQVNGADEIHARRNQHLWRGVSIRGAAALHNYLVDLHRGMPALTLQVRAGAPATRGGHELVRADCSGVDSSGSAFDAEAEFVLVSREGRLQRVEAWISRVAIGGEVIRRTDGDPRRYFRAFLDGPLTSC